MKYPTIRIEGAIVASDILDKIEQGDITGQRPADFNIVGNYKVKDEIARAWADAKDYWRIFHRKREALDSDERKTGTSETRNQWMIPFFGILGYKAEFARAEEVVGKNYAISHRDSSLDKFPIHIMGFKDELDKKRKDSGPRMSPHALVQEYLNLTEHLYAIVTNGMQKRLLRDSSRLIKLSYIEFDLERMMDEEHYADFAILYRLLHYTRMPVNQESIAESIMEVYHQDSLESGSRIRDGLSDAVKNSILAFSNGFLSHPDNDELRTWFSEDNHEEKEKEFFLWQLRLIYRLLFLMVIEERDLIFPKGADKKLKGYYYDYYSLNKLRGLSEKRRLADPKYSDYWLSVRNTFRLFENEKYGKPLGIAPLSGLFEYHQVGMLNTCALDNKVLMECLRNLSIFKNKKNNQLMRVNYASLNVEEFGSVYEGLLEYKAVVQPRMGKLVFDLVKGSERSSSGSHYTPDELVQPLIKHSLDYIIEDKLKVPKHVITLEAKQSLQEKQLLSITVCDVACGSGHILLNAARRIATQLSIVRTGEEQPSPTEVRHATRDVIRHCIYGVDLNPLAVELCKVALWLEAHNPNEPLNFLDHHIKCGNAIVGLAHREELDNGIANEAFKTLPGDDKEIAQAFVKRNRLERKERERKETHIVAEFENTTTANVQESMVEYEVFRKLPETTPKEITTKQKAYNKFLDGKGYTFLKTMCDTQVAQFFIPKTEANKDRLITDNDFRQMIQGYKGWTGMKTAKATVVGLKKRFFHWFLEFPEVFSKGGFDCILGNPPFLGDKKIRGAFGASFIEVVKYIYKPIGVCDLVTYFFRRNFQLVNKNGFVSLISTNSISQGTNRKGGLDVIISNNGQIIFAFPSVKWPGEAAVFVSLITIKKGNGMKPTLRNKKVKIIGSTLSEEDKIDNPISLEKNSNIAFIGNYLLGKGFILEESEAKTLIEADAKNDIVVRPLINGEDFNNTSNQSARRFVIDFYRYPIEKINVELWRKLSSREKKEYQRAGFASPDYFGPLAKDYPKPLELLSERVKPEREKKKEKNARDRWWQHARTRPELHTAINNLPKVIGLTRVSKTFAFSFLDRNQTFTDSLVIFAFSSFGNLAFFQSSFHEVWSWKYGTTLKTDLNYGPDNIFASFPAIETMDNLEELGELFYNLRSKILLSLNIGLTKFYNLFHTPKLNEHEIEKSTKCDLVKAKYCLSDIIELRKMFDKVNYKVLEGYNWNIKSEKCGSAIDLAHDFYEVDYLPENDNIRYTIHPDARKEVLKRLLLLNHERYEEEVAEGLHKKKDVVAFYEQKGEAVPYDVKFSDGSSKTKARKQKKNKVEEQYNPYQQTSLFEQPNLFNPQDKTIEEGSKVTIKNKDGKEFKYNLLKTIQKGEFTGEFKNIAMDSKLALAMLGNKVGDEFEFGGVGYEIKKVTF